MALQKVLRSFLLADALLTTASIIIGFTMPATAPGEGPESPLYAAISLAVLVVWLAALVGLWHLRRWGRALYLAVAGVGVLGTLLVGGEAVSGLKDAMTSVCWLVTGVVIALVYWSPLADTFRSEVRAA